MKYSFHPAAVAEFNKAIDDYELAEPGLGFDFAIEIHAAIRRAVAFPRAWPVIDGDIRRSLVRRFPFGVLYSLEDPGLYIIAVMHLHRAPGYWKHRK